MPGHYRASSLDIAYVVFRGVTIAAQSADGQDAALRLLREKIELHGVAIRGMAEFAPVEELNLVMEHGDHPPIRRFVKAISLERAKLELELGVDSSVVFVEESTHNFMIAGRGVDNEPQVHRLGQPIHGDDFEGPCLPAEGRTPTADSELELRRTKADRIRAILRCPSCRGELDHTADDLSCARCERRFPYFDGRPVIAADPDYDPRSEDQFKSANTYGQQVIALIEAHRDGWVLDCGSGSPSLGFYNVVHLDLHAFPHVDVVTDGNSLPFADETFDAVLSEAVLEHVTDPVAYTREVARVMKPGALVRLDVAFLSPYHGVPDHYFNMTRSGLRVVVEESGLEVESISTGPHQHPQVALSQILNQYVLGTPDAGKKQRVLDTTIADAIQLLASGGGDPFDGLTPEGIDVLAAGFSCMARKPR